jgi:propanol-preferring alcohol dehydrogenase
LNCFSDIKDEAEGRRHKAEDRRQKAKGRGQNALNRTSMISTMKAEILRTPKHAEENPLETVEMPVPDPGTHEIRIRVHVCGVCHTDLHIAEGELKTKKTPLIPGHQIVGEVDMTGSGVTRFRPGDRAGVTWLYSACGRCEYCLQGKENLCDSARFTGYDYDGGFAEYTVVPEAYAFPVPAGFPDIQAAPLLCAGVIGYRSLRLSEIQPGQRLGLYGFGASAHITIQVARHRGCEVYVFTRSKDHREHACELGAVWVGSADDDPPELMDSSIIFAPAGSIVPVALRVLKKGGILAINAVHMSPIPEMRYELIYHERTVRSIANLTRRDAEELLKLSPEIPLHTDIEVYPLTAVNDVLRRMKRSEIRGAAVLAVRQ